MVTRILKKRDQEGNDPFSLKRINKKAAALEGESDEELEIYNNARTKERERKKKQM